MASQMYDTLMNDVKTAMKAHDMGAVNALRGVLAKAKDLTVNAGKEMTDDAILQVIAKGVKQREESIAQFESAGRAELAEGEKKEMALLKKYLPEQLSEEAVAALVKEVIAAVGAASAANTPSAHSAINPHNSSFFIFFVFPFLVLLLQRTRQARPSQGVSPDRRRSLLAGADALVHWQHEDLAVADVSRPGSRDDALDRLLDVVVVHRDGEADLLEERHLLDRAAILVEVALLLSAPQRV